MTLQTTTTGHCDAPGCDRTQGVPPGNAQPYQYLVALGWGIGLTDDGDVSTTCPGPHA